MFDLQNVHNSIVTLEEIYSKVSEYELWKYYCPNFKQLDDPFLSELYDDSNPSCRIYRSGSNRLIYKDFGEGCTYDIFSYIQAKYGCTFKECLHIIVNDFGLRKTKYTVDRNSPILKKVEEVMLIRPKSRIDIIPQPFNMVDYNYWSQYHIPLSLLEEYNVYSCKCIHLIKGDRVITFTSYRDNPIYAYRFVNDDGNYSYKVYKPLEPNKKYKWLFSGKVSDVEGYDQLPLSGDLLILTKSLKDCMVYRLLGYNAISLQGEGNTLSNEIMEKLRRRFSTVVVNYDDDETGRKGANQVCTMHRLKQFYIDDLKDISDYVKHNGLERGKEMIMNKLKGIL